MIFEAISKTGSLGSCFVCMDIGSEQLAMQNLQVPDTAETRIIPKWLSPPRLGQLFWWRYPQRQSRFSRVGLTVVIYFLATASAYSLPIIPCAGSDFVEMNGRWWLVDCFGNGLENISLVVPGCPWLENISLVIDGGWCCRVSRCILPFQKPL
jgi:hypothetical protein